MSSTTPAAPRQPERIRTPLRAVAVIVPAHDEQELLGACLDTLRMATRHARRAGLHVRTLVMADACTDDTPTAAYSRGVRCLEIDARNVGVARAAGVTATLAELGREGFATSQIYLLHTDADSLVPPDWITTHVHAALDCDAVLGNVVVRTWAARSPDCARLYARARALEPTGHRVHGANLGVRADAYLRAGGFPPLAGSEDRGLVDALRASGAHLVYRDGPPVRTSARRSRRVDGGFSDFLSRLEG